MDFFYDGQVRRYVTQFMRIFIGFKYKAGDGTEIPVPVMYGDMSRQVANIIKENSENKMPNVPRVACYISSLDLDTTRLADPSFVSKIQIREREYDPTTGTYVADTQGRGYTVERLMPTPYKLSMKADIWTSNTDQKLQLLEQILVLFNPSLEIQTTDNYIDWTSLSVVDLNNINFSSRTIPVGAESDIDICTIECSMPIYITPPAKVKRLGIVKSIVANVFGEDGNIQDLGSIIFNTTVGGADVGMINSFNTADGRDVLLMKGPEGTGPNDYYCTFDGAVDNWSRVIDMYGKATATSLIHFTQPTGYEITGTFEIHQADDSILVVSLDPDTVPLNTLSPVDRIIDPFNFNPEEFYHGIENIPIGTRFLILENIRARENYSYKGDWKSNTTYYIDDVVFYNGTNYICSQTHLSAATVGLGLTADSEKWQIIRNPSIPESVGDSTPVDLARNPILGSDAWKNMDSAYAMIKANSIIEWTGEVWAVDYDPDLHDSTIHYITNLKSGVQYRFDGTSWYKSFEGLYKAGYWRLDLDA